MKSCQAESEDLRPGTILTSSQSTALPASISSMMRVGCKSCCIKPHGRGRPPVRHPGVQAHHPSRPPRGVAGSGYSNMEQGWNMSRQPTRRGRLQRRTHLHTRSRESNCRALSTPPDQFHLDCNSKQELWCIRPPRRHRKAGEQPGTSSGPGQDGVQVKPRRFPAGCLHCFPISLLGDGVDIRRIIM